MDQFKKRVCDHPLRALYQKRLPMNNIKSKLNPFKNAGKYELTQQHIFSNIYITFLADFTFISKVCNYYQTISFAEKTKNSIFKHIHASTIQNGFKELSKFSKGYCFKLICDSS